jgi:hypothetical protein
MMPNDSRRSWPMLPRMALSGMLLPIMLFVLVGALPIRDGVHFEPSVDDSAEAVHTRPLAMPAGLGSTDAEKEHSLTPKGCHAAADIQSAKRVRRG